MDIPTKEALIDKLLVFVNNEVEQSGHGIELMRFDFTETGEDAIRFMEHHSYSYEDFTVGLNACLSRNYMKRSFITSEKTGLVLTEEGQGRAISSELEKHAPVPKTPSGDIHIGTVNANGATQIGNNNTQNIENVFSFIVEQIDQSSAIETEKQEAKNLLQKFLEHPLAGTIVGMAPAAIKALFGGR